jgi:hypothetical protein
MPSKLSIYVLSLVSLQVRMQNKEEQQRIMSSECVEEHCLTDSKFFLGFSFPQDKTTGIPQEGKKKNFAFLHSPYLYQREGQERKRLARW